MDTGAIRAIVIVSAVLLGLSRAADAKSQAGKEAAAVPTDDRTQRGETPLQIVILGPPGAGKGTQAKKIAERYGIPHISTGAMLRAEVKKGSDLGKRVKAVMERGDLVADGIILELVRMRLDEPDCKPGFILDGFPRTRPQAEGLDSLLETRGTPGVTVIDIVVPEDELVRRMLARRRADDTESTIRNRIRVYHEETAPRMDFYGEKDATGRPMFFQVDGDQPIERVFDEITRILSKM